MPYVISENDIVAAAIRLRGVAVRTPLLENNTLNERVGGRVLIKPETLQHAGAFKFRGAYNRLAQLTKDEKISGVVAWSSGNHAQGVALAAKLLGIPAIIVMPEDAPSIKVNNTKAYGAAVRFYDRYSENREDIARALAAEKGAVIVPSYDDPHIIAGQGTVGLEIMKQATEAGTSLNAVLVPCGGGGLSAGTALAIHSQQPDISVYTVEPADFDDTARSLVSGKQEHVQKGAASICDALLSPYPGNMTFPILKDHITAGLSVSDAEVRAAVQYAWETLKLVVEPGGAVALAALLCGQFDTSGKTVALVLSGGNVDPDVFSECLAG